MVHAQPKMCKWSKSVDVFHQADIRASSHGFKTQVFDKSVASCRLTCKLIVRSLLSTDCYPDYHSNFNRNFLSFLHLILNIILLNDNLSIYVFEVVSFLSV